MSFDIRVAFATVPADLVQRFESELESLKFPAKLVLKPKSDAPCWQVDTPISDEDPDAPGRYGGDDAMQLYHETANPEQMGDAAADQVELLSRMNRLLSLSVSYGAGPNAYLVACVLAKHLGGVIWDPQLVISEYVDLTRWRSAPDRLAMEERGWFLPQTCMPIAQALWRSELPAYSKSVAALCKPDPKPSLISRLFGGNASRPEQSKLSVPVTPLRSALDLKGEAPAA